MNAIELVQYTTDAVFLAIFVAVVVRALRRRRRANVDAVALFGSLTVVVVVSLVTRATGASGSPLGLVTAALFFGLPFLTLRLVDHLVPVRPIMLRTAFGGWVLSTLAFLVVPRAALLPVAVVVLLYFVGYETYSGVLTFRASRRASGPTRPRLLAMAGGTLLLGAAILVIAAAVVVREVAIVTQVLGLGSALAYYVGFATPRLLRRGWQEPHLRDFSASVLRIAGEDETTFMQRLAQAAGRVVGAERAAIGLWDEPRGVLRFHQAEGEVVEVPLAETVTGKALTEQRAMIRIEDEERERFPKTIRDTGMRSAILAPITWGTTRYGVLGIYSTRAPLFAEVDLELVEILAGQVALVLRNRDLIGEVRALNGELAQRVTELDAANEELTSFAYAVSHDLRAPLRAIDGFSEVLLEENATALGADGRGHLERVRAAAQRMGQLIDDLLQLSRTTRAELQRAPVDLTALARSVAAEHAARTPGRTVTFRAEDGLRVDGDDRLLRVALDNLIGNAWKFTRPVRNARIELGARHENGSRVFYVRDNGVGFEMDYRQKLFTPFQRLHSPRDFEGSGIGLATVRRVIRRHGGDVWAESEPGAGATFFFTLPTQAVPGQPAT